MKSQIRLKIARARNNISSRNGIAFHFDFRLQRDTLKTIFNYYIRIGHRLFFPRSDFSAIETSDTRYNFRARSSLRESMSGRNLRLEPRWENFALRISRTHSCLPRVATSTSRAISISGEWDEMKHADHVAPEGASVMNSGVVTKTGRRWTNLRKTQYFRTTWLTDNSI